MDIIAHKMAYCGDLMGEAIQLKQYTDEYYEVYKEIYEACFREMRTALALEPVDCCDSREELMEKKDQIFLLIENEQLIGSVAVMGNEIDDLIVAEKYQRKGYGKLLLKFAIHYMQVTGVAPITLCVADWNQGALSLYMNSGFKIIETEVIKCRD